MLVAQLQREVASLKETIKVNMESELQGSPNFKSLLLFRLKQQLRHLESSDNLLVAKL